MLERKIIVVNFFCCLLGGMKMWKHVSSKKLSARKRGVFVAGKVAVSRVFAGNRVYKGDHVVWKTFSEKSLARFAEYVCGLCKHLVFRRERNTWVCDKGFSLTKAYCGSWVDDHWNIRIRMPDGDYMYLGVEE